MKNLDVFTGKILADVVYAKELLKNKNFVLNEIVNILKTNKCHYYTKIPKALVSFKIIEFVKKGINKNNQHVDFYTFTNLKIDAKIINNIINSINYSSQVIEDDKNVKSLSLKDLLDYSTEKTNCKNEQQLTFEEKTDLIFILLQNGKTDLLKKLNLIK